MTTRPNGPARKLALGLAAVTTTALVVLAGLSATPVAAAPSTAAGVRAAAPATTSDSGRTLTVDPTVLNSGGDKLVVTGKGFGTDHGLYIAVCAADGAAPKNLSKCLGGPVPDKPGTAWARVSKDGAGKANETTAKFGDGGSFSVTVTTPAVGSVGQNQGPDCSATPCAVYATSDNDSDRSQDLSLPVAFSTDPSSTTGQQTPPTTSTPTTPNTPSTELESSAIGGLPATVLPKSMRSDSVEAGTRQQVLFAGFDKGETVRVTLESAPTPLPDATADQDGIVSLDFVVPAKFPAGPHVLRAVGQTSKVTGIARFAVTAPIVTSSSVASSTASTSAAPSSTSASPSSTSSASSIVSSEVTSSASSAAPTSSAAPVAAAPARPVWPWYLLGGILLLLAAFAFFGLRQRRDRLGAENAERDRQLAEAAWAEQDRATEAERFNPQPYVDPMPPRYPAGGPFGAGGFAPNSRPGAADIGEQGYAGHGLLSGRDHPDNAGLLSGGAYPPAGSAAAGAPPTPWPPTAGPYRPADQASTAGPPADTAADAYRAAGDTAAWRPRFGDEPATERARPTGSPGAGGQQADGPASGHPSTDEPADESTTDDESGGRHSR